MSEYKKHQFIDGDILFAKPLNEMSGAVEEIYNMLHAEPKLDYVDNTRKYYFDLEVERIIPIKFTTGMPGPVTVYVTKNGDYFNDFTTTQGIINVSLGISTEQENAVYEITAKDSMSQGPSNNPVLQFSAITGGLQFTTQFTQIFENGALTTNTTSITFPFDLRYVDNSEGIRSIKSEIFLNDELVGEPYIQEYSQNQSETYITIPVSLGVGLYTIKLTGKCVLNNGLDFEVYEIYNFNVLQPNTAKAIVLQEDFGDSNYFNSLQFKIEDAYDKIMGGKNLELIAKCSIYNEQGELYNNPTYIYGYHNEVKTWDIGKIIITNDVISMNFVYEIKIYTLDGEPTDPNYPSVRKLIEIQKGEATIGAVTEGLLAYFDASSHSGNQETHRDKWESIYGITGSGSRAYFKLNDLNFGANDGWLKSNYFNDTILKLTGQGYGKLYTTDLSGKEIEWNPMECLKWVAGKTEYGFTVEVMYKTSNIGNFDAQVISCRPDNTTYNGFNIGLNSAGVSTTANSYEVVGAEEEWQHIAIVLDKEKRSQYSEATLEDFNPCPSIRFYVNGVLTKTENLEIGKNGETSESFNGSTPLLPILLNTFPGGLENKKFGECELKLVRFYNKGLTSSDIYVNYLSSLPQEKQEIVSKRNNIKTTNIPVIYFIKNPIYYENKDTKKIYKTYDDGRNPLYYSYNTFDAINRFTTADKDQSKCTYVNCTAYYCYYEGNTQKIETFHNLDVSLQGTSSLSYPVKNYKIYNYEKPESGTTIQAGEYAEVPFVPKGISSDKNWYASSFYTLKCDYMEQSHKNNTPTALYYDKVLDGVISSIEPDSSKRQELYSPAKQNGFRDAIDGFPCLVYYNDNVNGDITPNNFQGHADNKYAGSFMFNIDKEGPGLGFELPDQEDIVCVSYEGGSNENISAATFVLDEDAGITSGYEKYYKATMEPRHKYTKEKVEYKGEQLSKCYLPLIEAINALRPFNNLKTLSDITPEISAQFKTVFSQYFNVPYCITYFLQLMAFTQIDNVGKNAMFDIWGTKDPSTGEITWGKIFPRPYDMDSQMGETNSGEDKIPVYAEFSPTFSPEQGLTAEDKRFDGHYNVTESNLWIPFALVYWDTICETYKYLRNNKHSETDQYTIYSVNGINNYVKSITSDIIGERFYNKDAVAKYLSQYSTASGYNDAYLLTLQGNRENRYKQFLEQRFIYLDGYFGNREANLKTNSETQDQEVDLESISSITTLNTPIILRSSPTDPAHGIYEVDCDIYIQTYTPSYVYIDVDNKQKYVKYVDSTTKTDGYNGVKFTVTIKGNDKNVYIFNAGNIQSISGLNNLKLTSIDLTYANKITALDITNNPTIQRISIRNNPLVQTINVSNCTSLTKLNFIPAVSTHINSLNLSNCKAFNQGITITNGNLLTLNASNSAMATLTLDTNVNFENLNLNNCTSLTSLFLTRCNKLQNLDLINSNLSSLNTIKIERCENLETLTIPSGAALRSLDLQHNYGLHTLTADGCNGEVFQNLNLTTLTGLKRLSLKQTTGTSANPYVNILLPLLNNSGTNMPIWTGLLTLDLTSSSVQNIGYGITGALTSMDLSGISTVKDGNNYISGQSLTLQYCNGVRKITNLNYENDNLSKLFYHCVRLKEVSGELRTNGTNLNSLFAIDQTYETEFKNANLNTTEVLNLSNLRLIADRVTKATNWFFRRPDLGDVETTGIRQLINSMPAAEDLSGMFQIYSNAYGTFRINLSSTVDGIIEYLDFFRLNNDPNGTIKRPIKKLDYFFYGAGNALPKEQPITRHFFSSIADNSLLTINNMFQGTNIVIEKVDNFYPLHNQNNLTSIIGTFSGCQYLDLSDALSTIPSSALITQAHNAFVGVGSSLTTPKQVTDSMIKTFLSKLRRPSLTQNIDIHRLFYGSKGITSLPTKLFDHENLRNYLENISAMFANISTLTTIQDDILETTNNIPFAKLKYASGLFADDFALAHDFGANFFIRTPNLEDIGARQLSTAGGGTETVLGMFSKNNIEKTSCAACTFHEDLFKPLTLLNNASHLFYLNIKSSINKAQLIGFNIKLNDKGSTTLSTNLIPINLFSNNTKLKNLSYTFYHSPFSGFGSVKQVDNVPLLDIASISEVENFLPTSITNINGLFENATRLTGAWHQTLFKNKGNLVYANYVFQNTEITGTIPEDMFVGCKSIQELTKTFYNCNKLGSTLDLNNNIFPCHILQPCARTLRVASYTFGLGTKNNGEGGLHSVLKEYPNKASLFENCTALQNCSGFFYNCSNLHGPIPPNMFKGTSTQTTTSPLTDISYLFCNCSTLTLDQNTTYLDSFDNKRYLVPNTWLQECPQLTKANHLFANVGFLSLTGYNYMGLSTQNIDLYYQNPSNLQEGLKETVTIQQYYFPKLLFSYSEPLTNTEFACNNMGYLIVELDSYFMRNNKNLQNIERMFYNTNINTLGDSANNYAFKKDSEQGIDWPYLINARYAFNSRSAITGHAPLTSDLQKAFDNNNFTPGNGLYGIYGPNSEGIVQNLNELYKENGALRAQYAAQVTYSYELTAS